MSDQEEPISVIEKNPTERVQIAWKAYRGHRYLDIRTYFLGDEDEWRPTKKGITVAPDLVEVLRDALNVAMEKAPAE